MNPHPAATPIDPLAAFVEGAFTAATKHPIPLIATRFNVAIDSGLAVVATTRIFRNVEPDTIEATITFPVPVHAVLFRLEARIGSRVLTAKARRREKARETYESAVDRGKTAVLHEEVLRGVHMLSIAHIVPGAEIEVSATWAITLTYAHERASLRIPLTVGDIYGRSRLPDSDDLVHGGPVQTAELAVCCRDGAVSIAGRRLDDSKTQVPLDAPIDLEVGGWQPADLHGRAADGREVTLRIEPSRAADAALDIALLVDHSGSMSGDCSHDRRNLSKHRAVLAALAAAADRLGSGDLIDLWEFDDKCHRIGRATGGAGLVALIAGLSEPNGGTEIGAALVQVGNTSAARDVLLVTDGKSHALDIHALARTGRRFAVVLVGDDSLEANVGHLAALTGGEIFVSAGTDLASMLAAALGALRRPRMAMNGAQARPERVSAARAGMTVSATWGAPATPGEDTVGRAVAALAASLALPALDAEAAAALAEAEGVVTHLTSLVLVDEAGTVQEGIPATRKVALPTPMAAARAPRMAMLCDLGSAEFRPAAPAAEARQAKSPDRALRYFHIGGAGKPPSRPEPSLPPKRPARERDIAALAVLIDWDHAPQRLMSGDLSELAPSVAGAVRDAAASAAIGKLATQLGLDPVALVIALMARAASRRSRTAERIARAILAGKPCTDAELDAAAHLPAT